MVTAKMLLTTKEVRQKGDFNLLLLIDEADLNVNVNDPITT